jgi:gluconolactonase
MKTIDDSAKPPSARVDRRSFLRASLGISTSVLCSPALLAQRDWTGNNQATRYPDVDILVLDQRFAKYKIGNTPIQRLYHNPGMLWAEGTAWNGVGRYLVWSDIPNNRQFRWIEDDERVTIFRKPSGNSNGNTFDYEGRQLSCEHGHRRVVRYEHNGGITVLADKWNGKPLNAPNDIVVHPDGGIWFTDPGYGIMMNYEGHKAELETKEAVYRIDPKTSKMDMVTDEGYKPNGLCFSPDYKKLYVADTGGPEPRGIDLYDVVDGAKLSNRRRFCSMEITQEEAVAGVKSASRMIRAAKGLADGIRCDIDGNVWAAAGWAGEGYDGVHVFAPDGKRIGMILLPEICANLCFGGEKRNRLFMGASQSIYAVYVETQGAHIT